MLQHSTKQINKLLKNGVIIPEPSHVFIAPEVTLEKIAPGAVIHPFSRISGSKTSIGPGCVLGAEAPVTIDNCQLGAEVNLSGGYFAGATFLDGSSMGSGAHVRPGTLLEEQASGAHAVGLKQTVLFPYVVLGSLINFCDCLMAGGTSRKNHSEVGSSYVHFNYTPHRDKATASLIGEVPHGVLLDQPPVFLGGQGGLVGPARVAFGAIIPAGMIIRKDVLSPGLAANPEQSGIYSAHGNSKMVGRDSLSRRSVRSDHANGVASKAVYPALSGVRPYPTEIAPFIAGAYHSVARIVVNNLIYIGNIYALKMWYCHVRKIFMTGDPFQSACLAGARERLESISVERINRLDELAEKMSRSIELNKKSGNDEAPYLRDQKNFAEDWRRMKEKIIQLAEFEGDPSKKNAFLTEITAAKKRPPYLETVSALTTNGKANATGWLQSIVDRALEIWKTDK